MANPLRLAEGRTLVEQLRLLLGNVQSSVIQTLLLATLLVATLINESNVLPLTVWCLVVLALELYSTWDARRLLRTPLTPEQARRHVWVQLGVNVFDGLLWGSLPWIVLDTASVAGSILVMAVLAGVAGGSISSLSSILPVFLVYVTTILAMLFVKLWQLGDPAYNALALAAVLYYLTLIGHARNSSQVMRSAIELRFENLELIERLRVETESAHTANMAKSRFLAAASHDLRQPIHAQGLFLGVLARSSLNPVQRGVLANAIAASQASAEMLNTLLDFSRIEAGVVEPQIRPFAMQPLLHKIENELAPQADAKGLVYRSHESRVAVHSDPALVELVLRNLVSNAIRYTEQGGLLVACRARGSQAWLEVWDTGIGIEPSQQQEVFREFHQLGNPERDRRKGLGLGLAIAQGLARALGQDLQLRSRPGRGSVFRLALPLAGSAAQVIADEEMAETETRPSLDGLRVLVIDDDEAVRAGMLQLLADWGCECDGAESIEEAMRLARAQPPELVISDYRLRGVRTGAEGIAELRAELGQGLPALLITGDTAPSRLREARASGVPLLHKPVSPAQLHHKIRSVLEREQL